MKSNPTEGGDFAFLRHKLCRKKETISTSTLSQLIEGDIRLFKQLLLKGKMDMGTGTALSSLDEQSYSAYTSFRDNSPEDFEGIPGWGAKKARDNLPTFCGATIFKEFDQATRYRSNKNEDHIDHFTGYIVVTLREKDNEEAWYEDILDALCGDKKLPPFLVFNTVDYGVNAIYDMRHFPGFPENYTNPSDKDKYVYKRYHKEIYGLISYYIEEEYGLKTNRCCKSALQDYFICPNREVRQNPGAFTDNPPFELPQINSY